MTDRPELVQFGSFTPEHFRRHPVWIQCHIVDYDEPWYGDTDEETFRPRLGSLPANPSEGMLLAPAIFTMADGSSHDGFLTPALPDEPLELLAIMQPQLFLPSGTPAAFWYGIRTPDASELAAFYGALGKRANQVFPIQCAALEGLVTGISEATLQGFYSIPSGGTVLVTT